MPEVKTNHVTVALAVALVLMMPTGCLGNAGGARQVPPPRESLKRSAFQSLELKRRNWESNGTDVKIEQDGSYTVDAVFLGRSKIVRTGKLESDQLDMLLEQINDASFSALPREFKAPFKTEFEWWGYELTVIDDGETKSVRFHSENDTVPEALNRLLETIVGLTK